MIEWSIRGAAKFKTSHKAGSEYDYLLMFSASQGPLTEPDRTYIHIIQNLFREGDDSSSSRVSRRWLDDSYLCNVGDVLSPPLLMFGVITELASERTIHLGRCEMRLLNTQHAEFSHKIGACILSKGIEEEKLYSLEGPAPTTITVYRDFSSRSEKDPSTDSPFQQTP